MHLLTQEKVIYFLIVLHYNSMKHKIRFKTCKFNLKMKSIITIYIHLTILKKSFRSNNKFKTNLEKFKNSHKFKKSIKTTGNSKKNISQIYGITGIFCTTQYFQNLKKKNLLSIQLWKEVKDSQEEKKMYLPHLHMVKN